MILEATILETEPLRTSRRRRRTALLILAACLVGGTALRAEEAETPPRFSAPALRLLHTEDGIRRTAPREDPGRIREHGIYKIAQRSGVDLEAVEDPLVIARYRDQRLFYVFYKTVEQAHGARPYIIQRIKKIERTWSSPDDDEPEVRATWQVEVFKTFAGALKRPDQHHGSFGLGRNHRREIEKQYEIGFGYIPDVCEGDQWPYDRGRLFEYIQRYQTAIGLYDDVVFDAATKWTLTVGFGAPAQDAPAAPPWFVRSPELGIDLPGAQPDMEFATPSPLPPGRAIVLEPGIGLAAAPLGPTPLSRFESVLGAPYLVAEVGHGRQDASFRPGLLVQFDGEARRLYTEPGFSGATDLGLRLFESRERAEALHGRPEGQLPDARAWRYPGLVLEFDGFDRVSRMILSGP